MSSVGFGLIKSLIINGHPFSFLEENGIYREHFIGDELVAYDIIEEHTRRHQVNPQLRVVEAHLRGSSNYHYSSLFEELPNEVPEYWIREVKERKHHSVICDSMMQIKNALENPNGEQVNDNVLPIIESLKNELEGESEVSETVEPEDNLEFPYNVLSGAYSG
jgi:hypothetical protein